MCVVFCTLLLQFLQIQVLQHLSAFTVNLSYNLEPIYSIILAMLIFHEASELTPVFLFGHWFYCFISIFTNETVLPAKYSFSLLNYSLCISFLYILISKPEGL